MVGTMVLASEVPVRSFDGGRVLFGGRKGLRE